MEDPNIPSLYNAADNSWALFQALVAFSVQLLPQAFVDLDPARWQDPQCLSSSLGDTPLPCCPGFR